MPDVPQGLRFHLRPRHCGIPRSAMTTYFRFPTSSCHHAPRPIRGLMAQEGNMVFHQRLIMRNRKKNSPDNYVSALVRSNAHRLTPGATLPQRRCERMVKPSASYFSFNAGISCRFLNV